MFLDDFDLIFISKVFTDTDVPLLPDDPRIQIGGTGFFFDKAPNLPFDIEHHMPDYHLYDEWIDADVGAPPDIRMERQRFSNKEISQQKTKIMTMAKMKAKEARFV